MCELRTLREIGDPIDNSSIEGALKHVYAEVLALRPADPYEAVCQMNFAMWLFTLQFVEDLDRVRSGVLRVWGSPGYFPDPSEPKHDQSRG